MMDFLLHASYSPITLGIVVLLVPTYALFLALLRFKSMTDWVIATIVAGLYALTTYVFVFWYVFSIYLRWLPFIFFLAASLWSYRRLRRTPKTKLSTFKLTVAGGAGIFCGAILVFVNIALLRGYFPASAAVDLTPPFRTGTFVVAHGGSVAWINYHEAIDPYVAHALDIMKLDKFGRRANGILPNELGAYTIYGSEVTSPCVGTIIRVINDVEDSPVFGGNSEHPGGNQVAIATDSIAVWLVHLARGSIVVEVGQHVKCGAFLGKVGNSGNSSEPHLHIVAQEYHNGSFGPGVPIKFNGRFLVRNSVFTVGK
jgi:hypothetical protein